MAEIELEYSCEEALEIVKTAMERAPGITSYEVDQTGKRVVGRASGGLTSRGETVVVTIRDSEADRTTIAVHADQSTSYVLTANPWKYKSAFLDAVYDLQGRPIEAVVETVDYEETEAIGDESAAIAAAWMSTAKILLVTLGLLCIVIVFLALL